MKNNLFLLPDLAWVCSGFTTGSGEPSSSLGFFPDFLYSFISDLFLGSFLNVDKGVSDKLPTRPQVLLIHRTRRINLWINLNKKFTVDFVFIFNNILHNTVNVNHIKYNEEGNVLGSNIRKLIIHAKGNLRAKQNVSGFNFNEILRFSVDIKALFYSWKSRWFVTRFPLD